MSTLVSLLLPMFGANNGTEFPDYSPVPKTVSRFGDTKTVTAQSKYYGSSGYFDGAGDYLTVPHNTGFQFLSGADFTIECWLFTVANVGSAAIANKRVAQSTVEWVLRNDNGTLTLAVFNSSNNVAFTIQGGVIPLGQFAHVAATKSGNVYTLWLNGTQVATVTNSSTLAYSASAPLYVGGEIHAATSIRFLHGYIQDLRITKGLARYTENFTPPARLIGEISGTVTDDVGQLAARTVRVYNRATGELLDTIISDAVTGAYSFTLPSSDMVQVVALDDDAGTDYNALIMDRVIPQ